MSTPSVFAYCRVSTKVQGGGVSFPVQIEAAVRYKQQKLADMPWATTRYPADQPPGFYCEHSSAFKKASMLKRNAGAALLNDLKSGDHIIFYSVCRSFRNTGEFSRFLEECDKRKVTPHFIVEGQDSSTPGGRLMLQMWAASAEYYSAILSWRIKESYIIRKILGHKSPVKDKAALPFEKGEFVHPTRPAQPEKKPGKIYAYARVSTSQQYTEGMSIQYQENTLSKYVKDIADKNPHLTPHDSIIIDEAVSSFVVPFTKRKGGSTLCAMLKPGDHVVVLRMDRAFRSNIDFVNTEKMWRDMGVTVHLMEPGIDTSTRLGVIQMQMLATLAEMESTQKSERNKAVIVRQKEHGVPWNGSTYICHKFVTRNGKRRIVPDWEMFAWGLAMLILYSEYHMTVEETADTIHTIDAVLTNRKPQHPCTRSKGRWRRKHVSIWLKELPGFFAAMNEEAFAGVLKRALEILATPYDSKLCKYTLAPPRVAPNYRKKNLCSKLSIAISNSLELHSSWLEAPFRTLLAAEREKIAQILRFAPETRCFLPDHRTRFPR
jgi:DNA invertase Pin-like site-specific DNA recombinase